MKTRLRTLALATTLLASQTTTSSAATVLWDNTANATSGSIAVGNSQWLAQQFKTTASLNSIETLTLGIGKGGATGGNLIIDIYNSAGAGGSPGALVTSLATIPVTSLSGSSYTVSNLNAILTPSSTYYVVARGSNIPDSMFMPPMSLPVFMNWNATSIATGTGAGYDAPSPFYVSTNSTSWSPQSNYGYMSITAGSASAVPEPSGTLSLAALVVSAAGIRRRSKTAA